MTATALSPAAEEATPPTGHGGHHEATADHGPPRPHHHAGVPALTHDATGFPAPRDAATATILPLAVTVLAPALTAHPQTDPLVADAIVGLAPAVALLVLTATPDVHPALLSIGGAAGLWGGIGAGFPLHPTGTDLTEAGPGARNAMPSVSVKQV